ncbi:MAG: thymidine phosphorylase family protein [Pseudomonadales bacterium]|nr:thymidine phosphorylase family protein [Pseudomonadales bacterium]
MDQLRVRILGIGTHLQPVVFLRADSSVCRSEGLATQTRVSLVYEGRELTATLNIVTDHLVREGEIGLSDAAVNILAVKEGDIVVLQHASAVESLHHVRSKLYGHALGRQAMQDIVADVVAGHYSDIHLAAFVTACAGSRLDEREITYLTDAMVRSGRRLAWTHPQVVDKHCLGGLPGNRTTPIVVAIVAACGLIMPKSSSRAITSPAGTADTIETMMPVQLTTAHMQSVVEAEGACMVWGGAVSLSPADDLLIRVERALDLDSEGQMVASVLSKKIAAGSTHVLIDIPVGPTAKVRSHAQADRLGGILCHVGEALGLHVRIHISDGSQPVGRGIGPALEAHDVLAVLRRQGDAPDDLKQRSLDLAAVILEMGGAAESGQGRKRALHTLESGQALEKFMAIAQAQGGFHEPPVAGFHHDILAQRDGVVAYMNNRFLSRLAKLAGAPADAAAGLSMHVRLGERVSRGDVMLTVHAQAQGQLDYALQFFNQHPHEVRVEGEFV